MLETARTYDISVDVGIKVYGLRNGSAESAIEMLASILRENPNLYVKADDDGFILVDPEFGAHYGTMGKSGRYRLIIKVLEDGTWREHKSQSFDSLEEAALDIRSEILGTMLYGGSNLCTYWESIMLNYHISFAIVDSLDGKYVNVTEYIATVMGE